MGCLLQQVLYSHMLQDPKPETPCLLYDMYYVRWHSSKAGSEQAAVL
jgi:hypothetical protein